jgi:hypothetical protein
MVLATEIASYIADQADSSCALHVKCLAAFKDRLFEGHVNEVLSALENIDVGQDRVAPATVQSPGNRDHVSRLVAEFLSYQQHGLFCDTSLVSRDQVFFAHSADLG